MALVSVLGLWVGLIVPESGLAPAAVADVAGSCRASFIWPVRSGGADPPLTKTFDNPAKPWLPGHRGVDIAADEGTQLVAPAPGAISFAGGVGGKHVVSIRHHHGLTTTYEPARTSLGVGASVSRGMSFAHVSGHSDHCDGSCVHWGAKRTDGTYVDPVHEVHRKRIVLKPM
ncbi:M23 family metallopeptidase [Bifidobacterium margollesii]|nr:peptidoglycan DD-metalloendopeptidase family protein [Bifidobacterium margollesii]